MSRTPVAETYAKVQVGETTPWGVATAFCKDGLAGSGRWACATHNVAMFPNRLELVTHVDDPTHEQPCRIGMLCLAHDEVHGFRS